MTVEIAELVKLDDIVALSVPSEPRPDRVGPVGNSRSFRVTPGRLAQLAVPVKASKAANKRKSCFAIVKLIAIDSPTRESLTLETSQHRGLQT